MQIHPISSDAGWLVAAMRIIGVAAALALPHVVYGVDSAPDDLSPPPAQRPRVVVVKPVVLCDDDGTNPARAAYPKKLVDQVYTRAGLEFIYLEPVFWNYGVGRRGEDNLDAIVRLGREKGYIALDPRVVTLLFVSAVDGEVGPLGRGMQNGNVCFVCLGPEGKMTDPAELAFVVGHEVGHCLNLRHAVDDPAVSNKSGNLQGDGPFASRLTVEALAPSQRDTVLKSPLVQDRVTFHTVAFARKWLVDESWEPYIASATDDMLRFTLGLKAQAAIAQEAKARRSFAEESFGEMALPWTAQEQAVIRQRVEHLAKLTGRDWPMVSRLPWHFIKVKSAFCSGYAHTRGLSIVLSPRMIQRIMTDQTVGMALLLHEKLHVVQRLNPTRFDSLARRYGFVPVQLEEGEAARLNLAQNPDALFVQWAPEVDGRPVLIASRCQPNADGSIGMGEVHHHLLMERAGKYRIGEALSDAAELSAWRSRFPTKHGHDFPQEVSAHTSRVLLLREYLGDQTEVLTPAQQVNYEATKVEFQTILRVDGE